MKECALYARRRTGSSGARLTCCSSFCHAEPDWLWIGAGGTGIIRVVKDAALKQYGPEAYRLEAAPGNIVISAATPKGVYYAGQSLAQMLPAAFFNNGVDKKSVSWNVAVKPFSILDYPRFAWRAFMLDEARHFFGEEEVKRLIDQMGLLKMNVLHWHLSDDAGWRIRLKNIPN